MSWYEVFDDALSSRPVVAVSRVVEAHVGRPPTRSELRSARRAASTYARGSNAQALHFASRRADGRKVQVLLLARADADLDDVGQLHALVSGQAAVPRTPGRTRGWQGVEKLLAEIVKAGHSSRRVDLDHLDPVHAGQLADEVADALNDFRRLRDRLRDHARRADTPDRPADPNPPPHPV